jgi:hypothetical protein
MNTADPLLATLLDVLYELRNDDLPLVLGGGYGLYLRQIRFQESGKPSLLEAVPPLRAIIDLYTLIALMTEPEYHTSQELSWRYQATVEGRRAGLQRCSSGTRAPWEYCA